MTGFHNNIRSRKFQFKLLLINSTRCFCAPARTPSLNTRSRRFLFNFFRIPTRSRYERANALLRINLARLRSKRFEIHRTDSRAESTDTIQIITFRQAFLAGKLGTRIRELDAAALVAVDVGDAGLAGGGVYTIVGDVARGRRFGDLEVFVVEVVERRVGV